MDIFVDCNWADTRWQ